MHRGWFVGDFEPTVFKTKDAEVSIKRYVKGDKEDKHLHKEAIEITAIISGKVKMGGEVFKENDIILVEKKEAVAFEAIENTVTVVYKSPSIKNDKYIL